MFAARDANERLVARGGQCETVADCAYYPRRPTPDDAGLYERRETAGVTDKASALELERIGRLYTGAHCGPDLATSTLNWRNKSENISCEYKHCMGVLFF